MAKIVLIDDDPDFSEVVRSLLTVSGHEVSTAMDGRRGLDLCDRHQPAVVVTDMIMPECDGMEVIGRIRRRHPGTRIVAVSGGGWLAKESLLKWARRAGADAIAPKPVAPDALLSMVAALLPDPSQEQVVT